MTEEFIKSVRDYCKIIENSTKIPNNEFVFRCLRTLSSLYNLGIQLPDLEPATNDIFETQLESRMGELVNKFNGRDLYANVQDPYENYKANSNIEVKHGSLSDDLSDIYNDLKSSLMQYDLGGEDNKKDAIWQWRFSLHTHYGDHIINALTALHRLYIDYNLDSG